MAYTKKNNEPKIDVYEIVTNKILEKLEQGVVPWKKPWNVKTGPPANIITGKEYNGINVMLLGSQQYDSKYWLTFKQAQEKGGCVRKGEKGSMIVFWNFIDKDTGKQVNEDQEHSSKKSGNVVPILKYYTVFNVNQCDNLDIKKLKEELETQKVEIKPETITPAHILLDTYKDRPEIKYGFTRACYKPSSDEINMPKPENFKSPEEFYSTLYHEAIHSTGSENRLNRLAKGASFGDESYSKEELVAEMGASFLCAKAGIENKTIDNSAAYLQSWINALKGDKKLIITAAGQAQKAANYITGDLEIKKTAEKDSNLIESKNFRIDLTVPTENAVLHDPEAELRKMWTEQGISKEKQDSIIAETTAKAQPGASVGPFTIPQATTTQPTASRRR